jgi:serine protease Do
MGAILQPLTQDLAMALKLQDESGVLVGEVLPQSPAGAAGIQSGDVITALNGKKTDDPRELRMALGAMAPGTRVKLEVTREAGKKTFEVALAELEDRRPASAMDADQERAARTSKAFGGHVVIADMDDGVRQAINAPKELQGAVIVDLDPNSTMRQAGLREGDVIREVNKHPIKNAQELATLSQSLKENERVLLQVWSEGKSGYVALRGP